ncbi:hypothetical protein GQ457_14G005650 [Hibiscus cannabinus]
MVSSKNWATSISSIASVIYFLLIIFQIPLFRVPCRFGTCKTPIEITSSQLIATDFFPTYVIKVLLYPGAVVSSIIKGNTLPSYRKLLDFYHIAGLRKYAAVSDLQHVEVGSRTCIVCIALINLYYLSVVGAFVGMSRHGRMSLFGTMLIVWGLLRENILGQIHRMFPTKSIQMYPMLIVAVVCAFLSIKKDVRKLIHGSKTRRVKLL